MLIKAEQDGNTKDMERLVQKKTRRGGENLWPMLEFQTRGPFSIILPKLKDEYHVLRVSLVVRPYKIAGKQTFGYWNTVRPLGGSFRGETKFAWSGISSSGSRLQDGPGGDASNHQRPGMGQCPEDGLKAKRNELKKATGASQNLPRPH